MKVYRLQVHPTYYIQDYNFELSESTKNVLLCNQIYNITNSTFYESYLFTDKFIKMSSKSTKIYTEFIKFKQLKRANNIKTILK
jgi:hypothetical protein